MTDGPRQTKINADVNGVWHIVNYSENVDEAIKVFNWLLTSEMGKNILKYDFNIIPAIKGMEGFTPSNTLAADVDAYLKAGESYPWVWPTWPEGFREEAGKEYQIYIAGIEKSKDTILEKLDGHWQKLVK